MANIHDVAARITGHYPDGISTMKLNKLTFLAHAWSLVLLGRPLIAEPFLAWKAGPASRPLVDVAKGLLEVNAWPLGDARKLTEDELVVIESVIRQYGALTGPSLSDLIIAASPSFRADNVLGADVVVDVVIADETIVDAFSPLLLTELDRQIRAQVGSTATAPLPHVNISAELDAAQLETLAATARAGVTSTTDIGELLAQLADVVEAHAATVREAEGEARLIVDIGGDADTIQDGVEGPFEYWEHDHTGLVHVLWAARNAGLTLKDNADEVATRIRSSRWFAANSAKVLELGRSTVYSR
jgi:uncharacterized phage-associated protein